MDRRARIFAAGQEVFARKGYEHTTISEIVKTAGVAQGTFYLYYSGKKNLFIKIMQDFFAKFLYVLEEHRDQWVNNGTGICLNEDFYYAILNVFDSQKEMAMIFLREAVRIDPDFDLMRGEFVNKCKTVLGEMLGKSSADGVVHPVNADILAYALIGMVEKIAYEMLLAPNVNTDLRGIAHELSLFQHRELLIRQDF